MGTWGPPSALDSGLVCFSLCLYRCTVPVPPPMATSIKYTVSVAARMDYTKGTSGTALVSLLSPRPSGPNPDDFDRERER